MEVRATDKTSGETSAVVPTALITGVAARARLPLPAASSTAAVRSCT